MESTSLGPDPLPDFFFFLEDTGIAITFETLEPLDLTLGLAFDTTFFGELASEIKYHKNVLTQP